MTHSLSCDDLQHKISTKMLYLLRATEFEAILSHVL
jgi:hypothetical protein